MTEADEQKAYEERLQERLKILRDQLEAGKLHFAEGLKVTESLQAVRYAADGSVDLSTVDGSVRALALGIGAMHEREEMKKTASLSDVQVAYFNLLYANFGEFFEKMREHDLTPHQLASHLSKDSGAVSELTAKLPEMLSYIHEFWESLTDAVQYHVEDMRDSLKGTYGGDFFPSNAQNIASKCGIYLDTIVLPCPFMRSYPMFKVWPPEQQAYFLMKHALNVLQYRDLACADVTPPIVVILPGPFDVDDEQKALFTEMAEPSTLMHAEKVFGTKFASNEELMEFARPLDTIEKVLRTIRDPSRVLFDVSWGGSAAHQIAQYLESSDAKTLLDGLSVGQIVAYQSIGRMGTCNELLMKARNLGGIPLMDAPTSWQYLVWKLEYDAARIEHETNAKELHIVKGLQDLAENKMQWLGKVPPAALIELRKTGALDEIRHKLSSGIAEILIANPLNFRTTSERVFENIQNAFQEHRKLIYELEQKKWQFAGTTIASWLAFGSLAATAAVASNPAVKVGASFFAKALSTPKLKEIKTTLKEIDSERAAIQGTPVGILFKYAEDP